MNDHIQDICSKASKRLYFLRILQRAGFDVPDLVKMYLCYIRPAICLPSMALLHP